MANNQYVNKIVYGGNTLIDLTGDTVTAATLLSGYIAHDASGATITGTFVPTTHAVVVTEETDEHGGTIKHITAIDLSNDTVAAGNLLSGYTAHDRYGNAVTGTLVPSGVDTSNDTVTVNTLLAGYTAHDASGAQITGAYVTPDLSTDTVTAATLLAGYTAHDASGNAITGTYTVNLQAKSVNPTESQQTVTANTGYAGLSSVTVGAISSTYVGSGITRDPTPTASGAVVTIPAGYYTEQTTKSVSTATQATPVVLIDNAGLITATATQSAGYVAAGTKSATEQLSTQAGSTISPTESEQTAVAAGKYTLGAVKIGAISSTYVGSGITRRDDTDLAASGATVTVPAGYYADQETKSVTTMTLPTAAASSATSGYTSKATIERSTSNQYINIPPGYNSAGGYYTISAIANGSVTAPSSISGTSATVSTGTNTLTLTKTVSVTPNVTTAGYISSGTAGNSSVSLTASVTTKAAATITPGTTNQTIASGTYLTGAQTISGDANLVGSNILSGKSIFGVAGTVTFQTYYTGSSTPSNSLGSDGDIYLKTS